MCKSATVAEPMLAAPLRQALVDLASGASDIRACGAANTVELK